MWEFEHVVRDCRRHRHNNHITHSATVPFLHPSCLLHSTFFRKVVLGRHLTRVASTIRTPSSKVTTTIVDLPIDAGSLESRGSSPLPGAQPKGSIPSDKKVPRHKESTFETAEGTLHVQPFRKKGGKGLKAVLTFVPRASAFNRENVTSGADPFRGFFTLFWISVSLICLQGCVMTLCGSAYSAGQWAPGGLAPPRPLGLYAPAPNSEWDGRPRSEFPFRTLTDPLNDLQI